MLLDEMVVCQVRIGAADSVDFFALAGGEGFLGVQAPGSFEQALTAENFVEACDAAPELIRWIEECGV